MIYKPKGRNRYKVKFRFQGQLIHRSTTATTYKTAKGIEATIRAELEKGNWGILEHKQSPTLAEFLKKDFGPFTDSKFTVKPKTLAYYKYGSASLQASEMAKLRLDQITDQHTTHFAAQHTNLTPATINCSLRTLKRALRLACDWGKLNRMPKISLAKGERQRERALSDKEVKAYLAACPQPWQDVATILLGSGMRPGEVFPLRWENLHLNGGTGLIEITEGKSKAARRALPMMPIVFQTLKARHVAQGEPSEGWVFPAKSKSGHFNQGSAKRQHAKAVKDSKVTSFEPYCLRHTALTNLGDLGCDVFTLAKIAGHSSITITQRYCHPQQDAIERAFAHYAKSKKVVTKGGHHKKPRFIGPKQIAVSDCKG